MSNDDTTPQLDPRSFDAMIRRRDRLWGLNRIARYLGVSVDKARRLARIPECPIYKPDGSGTFFAFGAELEQWLTSRKG